MESSTKTTAAPERIQASGAGNREFWLDVVKGLGIICVVAGHYTFSDARYLYWFHMPLFFIMSGYLFKPVSDRESLRRWLIKRFHRLLVPYVVFVLLIFLVEYFTHPTVGRHSLSSLLLGVVAGGRMFPIEYIGIFGAFWFVTCLYATQVAFTLLTFGGRSKAVVVAVIAVAYICAHIEAAINLRHPISCPLNLDVALMALSYYAIGFFGKPIIQENRLPKLVYPLAAAVSVALIIGDAHSLFRYDLDMKYLGYTRPVLDIAIPVTMVIALCWIARMIAKTPIGRFIGVIGSASLTIMYLHMWIIHTVRYVYQPGLAEFTLIGIFVPLAVWWGVLNRFRITRRLFLGSV